MYSLRKPNDDQADVKPAFPQFEHGKAKIFLGDCFDWLKRQPGNSIDAVVTDPPYGLFEYSDEQQKKLRQRQGGVWRIPPSFDGHERSPLPRFTTLAQEQRYELRDFLREVVRAVLPLGTGVVLDTFAGSGSTLAAAEHVGYASVGVERDPDYFNMAKTAMPKLSLLQVHPSQPL
ncbi:MAG: site-specific DNA-methyltransferase [Synergistaceae bacterium]|jgi:DNA modification methylase|nr:site-specific DNA-methyltransferase [Synergistaceae bacterium]